MVYTWEEVSSRSSYLALLSHLLDVKPDIKLGYHTHVKSPLREMLTICGMWHREHVEIASTSWSKAEGKCRDGTPVSGSREYPGSPL